MLIFATQMEGSTTHWRVRGPLFAAQKASVGRNAIRLFDGRLSLSLHGEEAGTLPLSELDCVKSKIPLGSLSMYASTK